MAKTDSRELFGLIRDRRSTRLRLWSAAAALVIEAAVVAALLVAAQMASARASSERLVRDLRSKLAGYRIILLAPRLEPPGPAAPIGPRAPRKPKPQPKPLAVPDTRLLDRLDPQVAGYVRDNPAVESVLTREIVRDIDARVLDPRKLLDKSSIRVSFDLAEDGRVSRPRIEKSSGVPSIDHLAIELAQSISDYQLPPFMNEIRRLLISLEIGQDIVITLEGTVRKPEEAGQVSKQVQSALAFLRLALGAGGAAFMLQDIDVAADEGKVTVTRRLPKGPTLDFLAGYYTPETR
jgi:hypothetical protein